MGLISQYCPRTKQYREEKILAEPEFKCWVRSANATSVLCRPLVQLKSGNKCVQTETHLARFWFFISVISKSFPDRIGIEFRYQWNSGTGNPVVSHSRMTSAPVSQSCKNTKLKNQVGVSLLIATLKNLCSKPVPVELAYKQVKVSVLLVR